MKKFWLENLESISLVFYVNLETWGEPLAFIEFCAHAG